MFNNKLNLVAFSIIIALIFLTIGGYNSVEAAHAGISLDATLNRDLYLIEKYSTESTAANSSRLEEFHLSDDPDQLLKVFLYFETSPSSSTQLNIESLGVKLYPHTWLPPVGINRFGFLLAEAPANIIKTLLERELIVRAAAAYRQLSPTNDLTAQETGAQEAYEQEPPLRGNGVRLAVIDSGFQLDNDDLPEAAGEMDYADYPDSSEDVTDMISAHGTHVAGTVFGSGELSEGRWRGMAPDCEPIYIKIGNDTTAHASTSAIVGALRGVAAVFEADIATMSYGGYDGFNDGTSPEEQAVDWAVSQGTTVFVSAGNYGETRNLHFGNVRANSSTDPIKIVSRFVENRSIWELYMSWFDDPDTSIHRHLSATILNVTREDTIAYDVPDQISSLRGTELLLFIPRDDLVRDSSFFWVVITNHSDQDQDFHLRTASNHFYVRFLRYSTAYSVLTPSTADSCISVGAYTSRVEWTDYWGDHWEDNSTIGDIARFSSVGPRIDGLLKPEICAPGQKTISCLNSDIVELGGDHGLEWLIISNDGETGEPADYLALQGTSMSSPATAGSAGLILEANPDMTPAELRRVIYATARVDTFTAEVPNTTWGWGKMNVIGALFAEPELNEGRLFPNSIVVNSVYPNPFNASISVNFELRQHGMVNFILYDSMGRSVWTEMRMLGAGEHRFQINTDDFDAASGEYLLKVGNKRGWDFSKVTLIK